MSNRALIEELNAMRYATITNMPVTAANLIRRAAAALEAQEWQTIETAPKNSTNRLVWCPENQCTFSVTWDATTEPPNWAFFGAGRSLNYLCVTPTHWRPLPDPPTD